MGMDVQQARPGRGLCLGRERGAAQPAHVLHARPELLLQLAAVGVTPSAFVAGVGTGGK